MHIKAAKSTIYANPTRRLKLPKSALRDPLQRCERFLNVPVIARDRWRHGTIPPRREWPHRTAGRLNLESSAKWLREFVPHAANLRRNSETTSAAVVISSPYFAARKGECLTTDEERGAAS